MPTWMSHVGQNTVLEDDVVFLHEQERHQVEAGSQEPACRASSVLTVSSTSLVCCDAVEACTQKE
jgi:hypothetical protein